MSIPYRFVFAVDIDENGEATYEVSTSLFPALRGQGKTPDEAERQFRKMIDMVAVTSWLAKTQ